MAYRRKSCKKGWRRHSKTKRCRKIRRRSKRRSRRRSSRRRSRSRRRSSKKRMKATVKTSKCKQYLAAKMKENMHKWKHEIPMKNGRYISSQRQAMAMSYSQVKKKYPQCKRYF